jgi:hypothetical protein
MGSFRMFQHRTLDQSYKVRLGCRPNRIPIRYRSSLDISSARDQSYDSLRVHPQHIADIDELHFLQEVNDLSAMNFGSFGDLGWLESLEMKAALKIMGCFSYSFTTY